MSQWTVLQQQLLWKIQFINQSLDRAQPPLHLCKYNTDQSLGNQSWSLSAYSVSSLHANHSFLLDLFSGLWTNQVNNLMNSPFSSGNKDDNQRSNSALHNFAIVSLEKCKENLERSQWRCMCVYASCLALWYLVKTKCIVRPKTMEMLTGVDTFCSSFPWWLPYVWFQGGNTSHTSISIKPLVFGTIGKQPVASRAAVLCIAPFTLCVIQSGEAKAHIDVTTVLFVFLWRIRHYISSLDTCYCVNCVVSMFFTLREKASKQ